MRTKGLSIKELDERKKSELREFLEYLHLEKGLSLNDIAKLIGNKTSGYTSWLCRQLGVPARPFEEARLKGIKEKRRKYERKPFDGTDEDKAYLLGLRHGDLYVYRPWKRVIRVSTSSTHPAMLRLFRESFEDYGHIYQLPRYKKDVDAYEWNVQVILDESFSFLAMSFPEAKQWIEGSKSRILAYLSGFLDAEGSVLVTRDSRGLVSIFVDYYNENRSLLEWVELQARKMGVGSSLRLNKPMGRGTSGYHLAHNRDYWQLSLFGAHRIRGFLANLDPRHGEKIARKVLALSTHHGQRYAEVQAQILSLRSSIKQEVSDFVALAQAEFKRTHPEHDESEPVLTQS